MEEWLKNRRWWWLWWWFFRGCPFRRRGRARGGEFLMLALRSEDTLDMLFALSFFFGLAGFGRAVCLRNIIYILIIIHNEMILTLIWLISWVNEFVKFWNIHKMCVLLFCKKNLQRYLIDFRALLLLTLRLARLSCSSRLWRSLSSSTSSMVVLFNGVVVSSSSNKS